MDSLSVLKLQYVLRSWLYETLSLPDIIETAIQDGFRWTVKYRCNFQSPSVRKNLQRNKKELFINLLSDCLLHLGKSIKSSHKYFMLGVAFKLSCGLVTAENL
jgi:hypothetical protein